MKRMVLLVVSLVMLSILAGCKKDNPVSVVGFWSGTYVYGLSTYDFHMLFRTNGTLTVFDGVDTMSASRAEGTYSSNDRAITCTYVYTLSSGQFSAALTMNEEGNSMSGTFGNLTSTSGAGTMNLSR